MKAEKVPMLILIAGSGRSFSVLVAMFTLIFCVRMFNHYRDQSKCRYCGGEWYKHKEDCPAGGSGTTV